MTRLKTEWITYMLEGMDEYNRDLEAKTGYNLTGLMRKTFALDEKAIEDAKKHYKVAVVPITQGEGIIGSFSESVAAIVRSMEFTADVMENTDVNGIYDGVREGYNLFFFADDIRYLALNTEKNTCSDNNYATALGFIEVLKLMMEKNGKSFAEEKILQIGHGIVGREAVKILEKLGADFCIYDKKACALEGLSCEKLSGREEIANYKYILDFTNEGGWLKRVDLADDILYASPGVPYSMDKEAADCFEVKAVHDNLEIGTAIMLGQAIFGIDSYMVK